MVAMRLCSSATTRRSAYGGIDSGAVSVRSSAMALAVNLNRGCGSCGFFGSSLSSGVPSSVVLMMSVSFGFSSFGLCSAVVASAVLLTLSANSSARVVMTRSRRLTVLVSCAESSSFGKLESNEARMRPAMSFACVVSRSAGGVRCGMPHSVLGECNFVQACR